MSIVKGVGVLALATALESAAVAQTFTGGLRGAVRDANGVVPGVAVELINEATNQTRAASPMTPASTALPRCRRAPTPSERR